MKTLYRLLAVSLVGLAALVTSANAQTVYSQNIVGYVNIPFYAGYSLFENPLSGGNGQTGDNTLTNIFQAANVPNGTIISLWNPATLSFDSSSTFNGGLWSVNFTLNPGTGARLFAPTIFTNTFVGNVIFRDGGASGSPETMGPPPLYSGPGGIFLLGDISPAGNTGTNIFFNILGRGPNAGEQVTLLDSLTQVSTTSTYLGNNTWDTATPVLNVGQAAFLNVISGPAPVPEPSTLALGTLGVGFVLLGARRRHR